MKTLFTPVLIIFLLGSIILNAQTDDNLLRVVKIRYNVFDMELGYNKEIDAVDGYELLAGHEKLGNLRPYAIYQNVSSHTIIDFQASFKIINIISKRNIYSRHVCVDSAALASALFTGVSLIDSNGNEMEFPGSENLSGIPPGGYIKIRFSLFSANQFIDHHIGILKVMAIVEPLTCDSINLNEKYLYDNKKEITLFSERISETYDIWSSNSTYTDSSGKVFPNPIYWKTKGVDVVSGDDYIYEPLQPENSTSINDSSIHLKHPTIRMNRVDNYGKDIEKGKRGGDWMMSNIFDMRDRFSSTLSFSYQRTGKIKNNDYSRGFSDSLLIGPEHRVIQDGDPTKEIRKSDELIVELAYSDSADIFKLINPDESIWNHHPRKDSIGYITNNPALTIFGGGGYRRGFALPDWNNYVNDSALTYEQGLNSDIYDTGKDFAFKQAFIPIPDTMIKSGGYLRIRFRVNAEDNGIGNIKDDSDKFYIDNILILYASEIIDIGVNNIEIKCPYTIVPKNQAKFPVNVNFFNNTQNIGPSFWIKAEVKHENSKQWPHHNEPDISCYDNDGDGYCDVCHASMSPNTMGGYFVVKVFSDLDKCTETTNIFPEIDLVKYYDSIITKEYNKYYLCASVVVPGGDLVNENDTIYNDFSITFGKVFAYDPPDEKGINDVPKITGLPGRGLNLLGNSDGTGSLESAIGVPGGNGSGQIAMKFNLVQPDTIYGFQAYFASHQQSVDDVTFAIYENKNGIPGKQVSGSLITRKRGIDDIRKSWILDEYTTYLYETPVVLPAGTYWASVGQPQEYGFELGASAYRIGMVTTNYSDKEEPGKYSNYVMINNQFTKDSNYIYHSMNDGFFAYENIHGSGNWKPFAPVKGNPGYAHLNAEGTINGTKTYTRGTWIPMIRPYLDGSHYIVSVPENNIQNSSSIEIFPNPVINNVVIIYSVTRNPIPSCYISIYDVFGNNKLDISCAYQEYGKNLINFSPENLAPGVYFCRLNNGKEIKSVKFVVIK